VGVNGLSAEHDNENLQVEANGPTDKRHLLSGKYIVKMIPRFQLDPFDSQELVDAYIENGFVLVEDVILPEEQEEIKTDLAKINRGDYSCQVIDPIGWPLDDERLLGGYMYIGQPHAYSPTIRQYIAHSGLCQILDLIVGATVPFWNGAYKCMQTMFVTKKPGGNGSPWHQDEHPIPTRDRSLTGVWIPLSDTAIDNSCLWIIPDSHKSGVIYHRYSHNLPDVDSMTIARGFDDSSAIPVEMGAGSVLFFSGYLLHSSKKNLGKAYRPTLTIHYCTSTSWLSWQGELNYRGVVQVRGEDPYQAEGYLSPRTWVKVE